jgi:hypothetical protein
MPWSTQRTFPVSVTRTRYGHKVTCTPLTDPLRHLLSRLADTTGAPSDTLNPHGLAEARRYGRVYEHQGRVALTGAGAYHAGMVGAGGRT